MPQIIRISRKNQWYDPVNSRKIHTANIPRTGGIGIFISIVASAALLVLFGIITPIKNLSFILAGIILMFLTGILDDFENLRARYKLTLQIIAALVAVAAGFHFSPFPLPFEITLQNRAILYGVTLLWIVGITNAINLIDGIDGLAGGVSCIAALFGAILSLYRGHTATALFALAIAAAATGFLVFNQPPAKIFMGDSGSLILGYSLSVLPLIETGRENPTGELLITATLLVIPVFDTLSAIFRRIRLKKPIAKPDMDHLHHKLLKLGFSAKKILFIIYVFCIFSGITALLWTMFPVLNIYFLPLAWTPALILFWYLHKRHWHATD
jgi:UDP-GlcNAc:undecaprenyl-phosphate GlcNAc-1-phosphate transferase